MFASPDAQIGCVEALVRPVLTAVEGNRQPDATYCQLLQSALKVLNTHADLSTVLLASIHSSSSDGAEESKACMGESDSKVAAVEGSVASTLPSLLMRLIAAAPTDTSSPVTACVDASVRLVARLLSLPVEEKVELYISRGSRSDSLSWKYNSGLPDSLGFKYIVRLRLFIMFMRLFLCVSANDLTVAAGPSELGRGIVWGHTTRGCRHLQGRSAHFG